MKASEAECQQLGTLPFFSPASASGLLEWLQTAKLLKPESSWDALCPCESLATKAGGLASQNSIWWVTAVEICLGKLVAAKAKPAAAETGGLVRWIPDHIE